MKVPVSTLGGNSWDVQTLGPTISLTVGEEYILSFWGKAATGGTSVRMVLQNSLFRSNDSSSDRLPVSGSDVVDHDLKAPLGHPKAQRSFPSSAFFSRRHI